MDMIVPSLRKRYLRPCTSTSIYDTCNYSMFIIDHYKTLLLWRKVVGQFYRMFNWTFHGFLYLTWYVALVEVTDPNFSYKTPTVPAVRRAVLYQVRCDVSYQVRCDVLYQVRCDVLYQMHREVFYQVRPEV